MQLVRDVLGACAFVLLFSSTAAATPPTGTASTVASSPRPACVPGAQVQCACPGGTSGVQVCEAEGARFDACACAAGSSSGAPASVFVTDPPSPVPTLRADPVLWKAGVILVLLGAAGVMGGGALALGEEQGSDAHDGVIVVGGVTTAIGAALLVTGIPLVVIGGKKMPSQVATNGSEWVPGFVAVPGGGGLRWTF